MKPKSLLFPLIAITWIIATITYCANAAGPATNVITIYWKPPVGETLPIGYKLYSSTNAAQPLPWTVVATQTQTNFVMSVTKEPRLFFYVTAYNLTNSTWGESDPSNVDMTKWPFHGDDLGVRQGL